MQQLKPIDYPLHGIRLIEASAGTGKTYTLAALYVRLVLGHGGENSLLDTPMLPPQLLVVTFTKAATEELRGRIRERLVEAAAVFRAPATVPAHDDFLKELLTCYPAEDYESCAYRLQIAAEWMDESAIFTIHSWCQRMLSEHAFDSGTAFKEELTTDEASLHEQVAHDYWRTFLYPLNDLNALSALGDVASSPAALVKKIRSWLYGEGTNTIIHANGELLSTSLQPANALAEIQQWQNGAELLKASFRRALDAAAVDVLIEYHDKKFLNGNSYRAKAWQEAELSAWQGLLAQPELFDPFNKEQWACLGKYRASKLNAGGIKKGHDPIQHSLFAVLDEVQDFLDKKPAVEWPVLKHAGEWCLERLDWYKRNQALMGYNDLLIRLHKALYGPGGEVLANRIRTQFPMAMIDEFQDTDPLQFGIFSKVYPNQHSNEYGLTLVGDPKQAIYKFRGADIYTYLSARELAGKQLYYLPRNYRSSKLLVEAVNALFDRDEDIDDGAFGMAAEDDNPLPFEPVEAQGKSALVSLNDQPVAPLNYWLIDNEAGNDSGFISRGYYEREAASHCANRIAEFLNGKGQLQPKASGSTEKIEPAQIAVLVPDFKRSKLVRDQLRQRGVASVYLSEKHSIFGTDEAKTLLVWLEAIWFSEHEQNVKAALLQRLTGIADSEAEAWLHNEAAWESVLDRIRSLRNVWREKGILPMVRQFLIAFSISEKWLATAQGERVLTNILHLSEVLQQESQHRDGELGLLRWFARQVESPDGSEEHQQRLESDAERVKVVTYHKSKGLQYDLVFIPFVLSYRKETKASEVSYTDNGQTVRDIKPDDNAVARANEESILEQTRVLYVALTRAVYGCWLGLGNATTGNAKTPSLNESAFGRLLGIKKGASTDDIRSLLRQLPWHEEAPTDYTEFQASPLVTVITPALRLAKPLRNERWWVASYSALKIGAPVRFEETAKDTQLHDALDEAATIDAEMPEEHESMGMHAFPRGAAVGNFLHGALEWAWEEGMAQVAAQPQLIASWLEPRLKANGWEGFQADAEQWFVRMLQAPIQPCGETLAELPEIVSEMEFWLSARQVNVQALDRLIHAALWQGETRPELLSNQLNGMLKGFIDLTFKDSAGKYWVLDYKSNWLGNDDTFYSQEAMKIAMLKNRYDVQASLYMLALHRLLKARLPDYHERPEQYLGGGVYWFMRAPEQGQIVMTPNMDFIEAMDLLFSGAEQGAKE